MTGSLHHPATLSRICFFLLLSNIFAGCPQQKKESYQIAEANIELGTYHLQPLGSAQSLQDVAPEYRLVSVQDSGYLVSTDTGLSYVVDGAGQVTQLDKSDTVVAEHTLVWAAADDAVWLVTATRLKHSRGQDGVAVVGDQVRVLWFSARQILLWGEYQRRSDGGLSSGLQLYSLDPSDRVVLTTTISEELIKAAVPSFVGAEKFIAGGLTGQDFWLWTRAGGLLLLREKPGKKEYLFEARAIIAFPRIAAVIKDIGFTVPVSAAGDATPPEYVLGIAAGEGNRGALYIATKAP